MCVCVCVVVVGAVTGATVSMQTEATAARAPRHTYRGSRLCAEETASEGSSGRAGSERGNRSRYTSHTPLASWPGTSYRVSMHPSPGRRDRNVLSLSAPFPKA